MGRLFTYMVKAAAGQQPAPYTGYYGVWGHSGEGKGPWGVFERPSFFWFGDDQARGNAIRRLFAASMDVDSWDALKNGADNNWGTNYLTEIDTRFTSPAAIHDVLSANPDYLEAIRHLANTGSYDKLDALTSYRNRNNPNYVGSEFVRIYNGTGGRKSTGYAMANGVGNAQLIINNYLSEEARIKRAAEAAAATGAAPDNADSNNGQAASQSGGQAAATPVPQPSQEQLARAAEAFFRSSGSAAGSVAQMTANNVVPERALHNRIQQNIAAGRSMYDGVTTSTPGMTAGQKLALTTRGFVCNQQQQAAAQAAAEARANASGQPLPQSEYDAHTGAGLRMVGHSADGRTRTYVGKSGRGRITVGDNAHVGHYRGVGTADTNTRSNYADIRQSNTSRAAESPFARQSYTTRRR